MVKSMVIFEDLKSGIFLSWQAHFETPYVVHLHNVTRLAPAVPLFTFTHPESNCTDNTRYKSVSFAMQENAEVHGFAGYFDTVLYKDIILSESPLSSQDVLQDRFDPSRTLIKGRMILPLIKVPLGSKRQARIYVDIYICNIVTYFLHF